MDERLESSGSATALSPTTMTTDGATALIGPNETERMQAVARYDVLDTPPDGAFDRITALASRLFNVPVAIVSIVDNDRIWFKSHHGLDVVEVERGPGLCASAILHEGPWVVNDASSDPRALTNPLVAGEFGLKFYAGVPLRTSDGHNLGTLCVLDFEAREVTPDELRTLGDLGAVVVDELELRLATRRALDAATERERTKDAFVGMLSHELRTPITTIIVAAQLLTRNLSVASDPSASSLSADVTAESDRLLRLIDDLLVMTKVERQALHAESEPVLLQRVLPLIVDGEKRRSPDRLIRLEMESDLAPIAGDQTYLEQVVSNLVSNAMKYSPKASPIDIAAKRVGADIEIRVRDRGIGLAETQRDEIFGLFVRTPDAMRQAAGAGIGLYVCKCLVEAMNGSIWVQSPDDADGGTIFGIRLGIIAV